MKQGHHAPYMGYSSIREKKAILAGNVRCPDHGEYGTLFIQSEGYDDGEGEVPV